MPQEGIPAQELGETNRRQFLYDLAIAAAGSGLLLLAGCNSPTVGSDPAAMPHLIKTATVESTTGSSESLPPATNDAEIVRIETNEHQIGAAPVAMEFIGFPRDPVEARSLATRMAANLLNLSRHTITPLVIMEPTFDGGNTQMDLAAFDRGTYREAVYTFFATLKESGVSDEQMGMWVPFPEPNDPGWKDDVTDPALFIRNTTAVSRAIKAVFPKTPVSIMLDSQTCADWSSCTKKSTALYPYLLFPRGIVDAFGLQGFTWDNQDSPGEYLSSATARYAAQLLKVRTVWFNTGTYTKVNNPNGKGILEADDTRRAQVFTGVLAQVHAAQQAGLRVGFINVFAQDKLNSEAKDGQGTANNAYETDTAVAVLKNFVGSARAQNVPVAIFDPPKRSQ